MSSEEDEEMPNNDKNIVLTPLNMCRICLNDKQDEYVDVMAPNEPHLLQHVKDYYRVEISGRDGKSTKLCLTCMEYINIWQGHIEQAKGCQLIVNYLAEKRYMSPASTSRALKRSMSLPNKRKKSLSRRSKRKRRSSSIPEHEIPSTSTSYHMIQSTSYHMMQSPSTSTSNPMIQSPSTSTSNHMIQSPSTSIEQSTSASIQQSPSISEIIDTENVPDFSSPSHSKENDIVPVVSNSEIIIPLASNSEEIMEHASTSDEVNLFASTSTEVVPHVSQTKVFSLLGPQLLPSFVPIDINPFVVPLKITPLPQISNEINVYASTSTDINSYASTSTDINSYASTSTEINSYASTSTGINSYASTSTDINVYASTSTGINSHASTSTEINSYASTSTGINSYASTSTDINVYASTSTGINSYASTSTEINSYASTSTGINSYASTSTDIVPSYTINEISLTGNNPVWYPIGNEITDPEHQSKIFARSKSFKAEYVCIFCSYQHEEISRNVFKHILFCPKHSKPYACVIENCHCVFPSKSVFIPHYRTHLNLNSSTYLCHNCFSVLTCSRRSVPNDHIHQNVSDLYKCCSLTFATMTKLVLHKLINHCAIVVTSNNRSRTLQKQNLNIIKTELDDVKVGLDVPGAVSCNQIIKDNGRFKCYCCPKLFNNVLKFIEHTKIKHKNLITLKDKGIKFCPLCDHSYLNEQFSEHIEHCTNTLKVGNKSLNHYGCVHCRLVYTNISPREIRNHVLYCKSFDLGVVNNKLHHVCRNCTYTSADGDLCIIHANSNCIYLQLKMRYAMGPDEKNKVLQRWEFVKQNAEQQEDENCTNDEDLNSSNTTCNTARQKLLKFYYYFCNNCKNLFFDKIIFLKHMNADGSYCRVQTSIYCQKCLTEFDTYEEYQGHLPSMPKASPLAISIKEEILGQQNDEDCDMEVVRINQNYFDVKVEVNNENFIQKQEPLHFDETSDMQYQELEQEQGVSSIGLNSCYACPEMELTANGIYMHCEVEDKPDLNQLLLGNVE